MAWVRSARLIGGWGAVRRRPHAARGVAALGWPSGPLSRVGPGWRCHVQAGAINSFGWPGGVGSGVRGQDPSQRLRARPAGGRAGAELSDRTPGLSDSLPEHPQQDRHRAFTGRGPPLRAPTTTSPWGGSRRRTAGQSGDGCRGRASERAARSFARAVRPPVAATSSADRQRRRAGRGTPRRETARGEDPSIPNGITAQNHRVTEAVEEAQIGVAVKDQLRCREAEELSVARWLGTVRPGVVRRGAVARFRVRVVDRSGVVCWRIGGAGLGTSRGRFRRAGVVG